MQFHEAVYIGVGIAVGWALANAVLWFIARTVRVFI